MVWTWHTWEEDEKNPKTIDFHCSKHKTKVDFMKHPLSLQSQKSSSFLFSLEKQKQNYVDREAWGKAESVYAFWKNRKN